MSWKGSGNADDIPSDYSQIVSPNDPTEELWNKLTSDSKSMEDYMWTRDYIDALRDFSNITFTPQEFICLLYTSDAADEP